MFRIGEFSQIAQVPTSQLRYYDRIGLLQPVQIDEWTSYRYYSITQLPRLNRILALKELGLSLEQIKRLLDEDISTSEIRGMFTLRKAQIEQQLQDEVLRLQTVEARLSHLEAEGELGDYDVVLKSLPETPFIGTRVTLPTMYDAFTIATEMRKLLPPVVGKSNMQHITAVFHSSFFQHENVDVTLGYTLSQPTTNQLTLTNGLLLQPEQLPAVETMATAVRVGGPENNIHTHAAIGAWAEENGYHLDGKGREQVIIPPQSAYNRQEMVTEIQFPVVRTEH